MCQAAARAGQTVVSRLMMAMTRVLGTDPVVRDYGLLESALARARASAFGEDAYPGIHEKAAALLHSLARNHDLIDGNKGLALAATIAFFGMNGIRLTFSNDAVNDLVIAVAAGTLDDVTSIAPVLAAVLAAVLAPVLATRSAPRLQSPPGTDQAAASPPGRPPDETSAWTPSARSGRRR